jgi:hypothetical protein
MLCLLLDPADLICFIHCILLEGLEQSFPQRGCVTLHAVGTAMRSRTMMPHARGLAPARRDPPETRRLERRQ